MYVREHQGTQLTFAVSGLLWHNSLVMMDGNTRTLWSHLYGRGMQGPLKDVELKRLPVDITDWRSWRELHPKTTAVVLSRTSQTFCRDYYQDLRRFVVGLSQADAARCWPYMTLLHQPVVNDMLREQPVLVTFDAKSATARVFDRSTDQGELTFVWRDTQLHDEETASVWDLRQGKAIGGPLKGTQLRSLPSVVSFRDAWMTFYPHTTVSHGDPN